MAQARGGRLLSEVGAVSSGLPVVFLEEGPGRPPHLDGGTRAPPPTLTAADGACPPRAVGTRVSRRTGRAAAVRAPRRAPLFRPTPLLGCQEGLPAWWGGGGGVARRLRSDCRRTKQSKANAPANAPARMRPHTSHARVAREQDGGCLTWGECAMQDGEWLTRQSGSRDIRVAHVTYAPARTHARTSHARTRAGAYGARARTLGWRESRTGSGSRERAMQDGEWRSDRGPPYVRSVTMFAGDGVDQKGSGNLIRRLLGIKVRPPPCLRRELRASPACPAHACSASRPVQPQPRPGAAWRWRGGGAVRCGAAAMAERAAGKRRRAGT